MDVIEDALSLLVTWSKHLVIILQDSEVNYLSFFLIRLDYLCLNLTTLKNSDSTLPKQEGTKEENKKTPPMALVTQPQIKEMTPHSYISSTNRVGSSSRKTIDIPPNVPGVLRILYKNMMKKPSGCTIPAMVDPFVGGLEHHDLFVGQEDVY